MSEYSFGSLYNQVQFTFGIGAKYSALEDIFNNNTYYFTADQAERLIRLVSAENNRLQLAKKAYYRITDTVHFSNLYDMFDNQSTVEELKLSVGIR
jgi:hypothetical protein